jgi:hypothetical protein
MFGIGKKKIRYRADYEVVLESVKKEMAEKMAAYGEGMKLSDVFELYKYAREQTNLSKHEDDLTDHQLAWKQMYTFLRNDLLEKLPDEQKQSLEKMDGLYHAHDIFQDVVDAMRAVETLFIQQEAMFSYYEEKSDPENDYHVKLNAAMTAMLAAKDPKEALKIANEILQLIEATKAMLINGIKRLQLELQNALETLVKASEKSDALVAAASEQTEESDASKNNEWITLSDDLFEASVNRMDVLIKEFALDAKFPQNVISRNGANPNEVSDKERQEMAEQIADTGALKMVVFKKLQEIRQKRDPLNGEVFGGKEQYETLANEAAKDVTKWLVKY